MEQRRTLRGWGEYLDDPKREFTLAEFAALMALNTREYARLTLDLVREQKEATEHLEGMVGAMDDLLARSNPGGYAASAKLRAALDARRDAARDAARKELAAGG